MILWVFITIPYSMYMMKFTFEVAVVSLLEVCFLRNKDEVFANGEVKAPAPGGGGKSVGAEGHSKTEKKHSDGVPTSTRFVGKMRGSLSRMHSLSSQDDGPIARG